MRSRRGNCYCNSYSNGESKETSFHQYSPEEGDDGNVEIRVNGLDAACVSLKTNDVAS
jgi:hypothetical protein